MKVNLVIIGAGPGGYEVAVKAAKAGLQVVIIEKEHLGGTCLNVGCIPTKCLCHTAEVLETLSHAVADGIKVSPATFDLSAAIARKDAVVEKLGSGIQTLLNTPNITLIHGEARLGNGKTVIVNDETIEADNIIIATGSETKFLPIEGAHCKGVVTSTEMLSLTEVPRRLAIIGGGVIGLEFASIYAAFGSEVTVVEYCKEILPAFDRDMAKRLRTALKKRGITFHVGSAVQAVRETEGGYAVEYEEKGKKQTTEADLVLMAVGRAANLSALNLDEAGIAYTRRGITVNEHMQTNVPGIYAVGDINGIMQLAHAATFQSYVALNHILGKDEPIDLALCPAAVFTLPELAMVGVTEDALKEKGVDYAAHKSFYRANGKALSMDAEEGIVKVLTTPDGHIQGAHILGAHAADLIHEITIAMAGHLTFAELQRTIHAHPSLSELFLGA